jgi:hypothetical protein
MSRYAKTLGHINGMSHVLLEIVTNSDQIRLLDNREPPAAPDADD